MSRSRCAVLGASFLVLGLLIVWPTSTSPAASGPEGAIIGGSVFAQLSPRDLLAAEPDPVPLRRLFLPADRIEAAVAEAGSGPLMKLPQKEFDLRLRTAGQEVLASANPARIVEAQYRATWNSGRLVGTAEWGLANSTPRPTAVPLDALRVAILAPRWADGRSAKIFRGTLAGRNGPGTYLWADDPAGGRIAFNWSARGIEELGEERIELGFPAVPVARLELTLPAERIPTSSTPGVLLTGPFPASNPRERLWRLTMGSLTRVVVALRLPLAGELSPPLRLLRTTRYSLGSGEVQANWDLQLASLRGAIREPRFEIDPGVRVVDVVSDAVEGWRFEPGATDDAPGQLAVRLREPTLSTRLQIVARQSLGLKNQTWTCPTIRASGELPGSETIQLTLVSPWTLERWTAGDFRLVQSEQMQNREHQLTWTSTATPNEDRTERKRPTVQIRPRESQFQTTETLNWRLEPGRNRLTARIQVQVQRGPIPALVMQLPAGYKLDSADAIPVDPGLLWQPRAGLVNGWQIEPSRALTTGQTWECKLELQGPAPAPVWDPALDQSRQLWPLPKLIVVGTPERRGTLIVQPVGLKAAIAGGSSQRPSALEFSLPYQGFIPDGEIRTAIDSPVVRVQPQVAISQRDSQWEVQTRLLAQCESRIQSLVVSVPQSGIVQCEDPLATVQRVPIAEALRWLPWLGVSPLGGPAWIPTLSVSASPGDFWRIRWPQPLIRPAAVVVSSRLPIPNPERGKVLLPLPSLGGAVASTPTVTLAGPELDSWEVSSPSSATDPRGTAVLTLRPRGMPKLTGPSGRPWVLSEVRLQESILAEGSRATVLKARIVERAGDRYPVVLPQGARLEAVRVNGKWLDLHEGGDSATLDIPVSLRLPCDFEIEYRSETVPGWVVRRADSPLPDMPGELGDIRRTWNLDSHWVAWPWAENGVLAGSGPTLWVLPGDWLRAAGWCLGLVLAGGLWVRSWPNRESRSVRQPAWVAGGFCGLALLLPSGWAMVLEPGSILAGVFLIVQLIRTSRQPLSEEAPSQRSASRVKLAAGAMVLTLTLLCHSEWIRGQALPRSAPVAVYYTPGPANAPESWTVLAPESLLTKLDSLSRSPLPALTLASAEYEGTSANATATFEARYLVDCNREGDQTLNLPLGGVRLESAKLDGLNAYPDATKPDRLAIPIRGVGQHELVLRFAATPQANGADREVRFTVPDLPACKVNFTAGLRGRQLQVPTRRGGQTLRLTANGLRAEVDHGSGSEIAIRWREGVAEGTKPTVVVREASVWDLDESTATLTAAFLHRVEGGTVDRLRIECPETLEPGRLIVRSLDPRASNIGIRDWQVGPPIKGWRTLELRLQGPTDGQFLVILRGYPLKVASLRPALRFPRTNATAEIESFHAVRYNGIAADSIALVNAIDFPAEPVLKEFASVTELGFEKNPPARVVRRVSEGNSELRPVLLPPSLLQQTAGEVAFTVGRRVEIEGAMRGTGKDLSWLEFDLPPAIRVHEVRATGLLGWSRIGSRVQVWGQGPANEWLVRWTGSLAVDLAPDERPQTAPAQVDCPLPRWIVPAGVSQEPLVVRVRPTEGWSVQFPPASGVRPRSDSVSPGEQVFLVEGPQISQMKALVNWQPRATPPAGPRPPKGDSGPAPIEPPVASPVPPPLASVAGSARNEFHSLPARVARTAAWSLAVLTLAWFVRRNPRRWTPELIVAVAALLMLACAPWSHAWWLFLLLALAALFARGLSLGFRALQSLFRETGS